MSVSALLPNPPNDITEHGGDAFERAAGLDAFVRETLFASGHALFNRDHSHLAEVTIGYLWTNVEYSKAQRTIIGTAEMPKAGGAWGKARGGQQLREWFGDVPDFLITLYAPWFAEADDASRLALIEHELYHCSCHRDETGEPLYNDRTGRPLLTMRGHDVEQFIGVVRRYGPDAAGVRELVEVAERGPTIALADIAALSGAACGSCK